MEGLACGAGARGEAKRAAKLFGAAESFREAVGYWQEPRECMLREPYLTAARSQMDEASWEEAFTEGQAMGIEEAVEYALSEEDVATPSAPPQSNRRPADEPLAALTSRGQEIALLVAQGLSNRQIAQELSISERTVENHIGKILKKQGFSSRARIATWVAHR